MTESGGRLGHPIDRRTFLAGAAGAAGALYLGACGGGSGTSARALHLAGGDAGFPSPFAYSRGPGYVQMSYIYDTLLWTDASGRQLPWLASRVRRSSDGLTYTFDLRDNVRWHDGRPLTPADVVFTFDYYAKQTLSPEIIAMPVPGIAEVKATGPRTVEFRLKAPIATFLGSGAPGRSRSCPSTSGSRSITPPWRPTRRSWWARVPIGSSPTPAATAPTSTPPTTTTSSGSPS